MVNIGDPETQEHRQDRVQKDFSFPTDQTIFFFFYEFNISASPAPSGVPSQKT